MTTSGRALRQTAINNDIFIMQKHYKNKVANNLNSERKKFQNILTISTNSSRLAMSLTRRKQLIQPENCLKQKELNFQIFVQHKPRSNFS
jgi:hypothetical protein